MKFVIQRVSKAEVFVKKIEAEGRIEEELKGQIGCGFLVLVGICADDTEAIADKMVRKMLGLRIFADSNGKSNLDLATVNGSLLLVSQFTLYADCKKGNRPSFINAADPIVAEELYQYVVSACAKEVETVKSGVFGASMRVSLVNEGPYTIILDSDEILL
ncbi:MAG: D-tyrosyl-tRNA(Tyr) deacylase [Lachnospiraceae bacterium]|jgi:D-tyrosyl-tRNA(Tyr) deacylase|nr:D-tyrosyl-tRNA(Tyr) deacylase [Lachnospiraceae bacterium]